MKISRVAIRNFLGARSVDLSITRPITLVCGSNASGKSSVAEAVRMALIGEPGRVLLKKECQSLVTEGQAGACAIVEHDAGKNGIILPSGAREHTGKNRQCSALPYALDAPRFANLSANDRRAFLFDLMCLRTDGDAVVSRMAAKGCDPTKVQMIATHLRAGFEAAHKEAHSSARDAKSSWRTVTGETYGRVKAATWTATKPEFSADRLLLGREELARVCSQVEDGTQALGDMQGRAKLQASQSARLAGLRETARRFAPIEAKLQKDVADLAEWQAKVERESRKVGKRLPAEPSYSCPSCGTVLRHDHANGALVEFTPPPPVNLESAERLREYERARDLLARSVENDKRDLANADSAAKMLAEIGDAQDAPALEEIEAAKVKIEALKKSRAALQEAVKSLEADERQAAQADDRTDVARSHHADVEQWEAIADALAPGGIPGEMLSEALAPINDRLASSSKESEWLRVGVDSDMEITGGGRPYRLLSESERWRTDAMIAEAISHLSGIKLVVLDRVDALDLAGREDLLYWLDGLVTAGQIDTALLFATLKALPERAMETIDGVWIENGIAGKAKVTA